MDEMSSTRFLYGTMTLPDGQVVEYRHIDSADTAALQRFHSHLSARTIYQRFFGVMPELSDRQAAYFTRADGVERVALVAIDPDEPNEIIGVVRIDHDPGTDAAEYAAVVADRWQGHGIGYGLTQVIVDAARQRGINRLYALVLPDNAKMLGLLADLKLPETKTFVDGVERVELDLTLTRES